MGKLPGNNTPFQILIRVFQRLIPTRKKNVVTNERPETVITLLLSTEFGNNLVPLSSVSLPATSEGSLRILHDRTYLRSPDVNLFKFSFECTGAYVTLMNDETTHRYVYLLTSTNRILPIYSPTQLKIAPPLPPEAIRQIGAELISDACFYDDFRSCAQILTTCALVCKGWYNSGVHDLLWSSFPDRMDMSDTVFRRLVGCVKHYPWIGERLSALPCPGFDSLQVEQIRSLYDDLMKVATNLRRLNLMSHIWDLIRSHLPSLQQVNYLNLSGSMGGQRQDLFGPIKLYDMLEAINRWTCLNEMWIRRWELERRSFTCPSEYSKGSYQSYVVAANAQVYHP